MDALADNVFSPHFEPSVPFQLCAWLFYLSVNRSQYFSINYFIDYVHISFKRTWNFNVKCMCAWKPL